MFLPVTVPLVPRTLLRGFPRMSSGASLYRHAKTGDFTQIPPALHNPFSDDPVLKRTLRRLLSHEHISRVEEDLSKFGDRIVAEIDFLGRQCELNQPRLEQHDAWGRRVDQLIVCPEWYRLKEICAEEGLISIGYDDDIDPITRRVHQIAKIYLFSPSAGLTTCPMAMTDGAVKTLKTLGLYGKHYLATDSVNRLTSTDGKKAWTSGQWMTEKRGGSDVAGGCDTYAEHIEDDKYRLHGYKWFSSAVDADVALTLARIVDKDGEAQKFHEEVEYSGNEVRRFNKSYSRESWDEYDEGRSIAKTWAFLTEGTCTGKEKFGDAWSLTLPIKNQESGRSTQWRSNDPSQKQVRDKTELLLDGAVAHCVGEPGRGVANISNMLNITRIHNAVASVSGMRRVLSLARDYSTRRVVFGRKQAEWPLHTATLAKMEVETRGCFLLLMEAAELMGRSESGRASDIDATLLRLVTPIVKLYTGKMCVPLISEAMECFGGQGYIEDTGIPTALRDAQVTPIWEGTTNILSLDVLRVFGGKENLFEIYVKRIDELMPKKDTKGLQEPITAVQDAIVALRSILQKAIKTSSDAVRADACARQIAFGIARIWAGSLLIRYATDEDATSADVNVARRWCCEQPLVDLKMEWMDGDRVKFDRDIVFENFSTQSGSKL